ncbi:MAG: calcium/sodium antiporter [Pseudomonadales bacterium]|nr:calcium/sodium antiporter [Pseudomonadales bacterium]
MITAFCALIIGIVLLVLSADKFVEGAAAAAKQLGWPPMLIGMLIIGFGSSAPEMVISGLSAWGGNPGLALGNAFGSNITNIALILGVTAVISPIAVESTVLRRELPLLMLVTIVSAGLFYVDGELDRFDALALIVIFIVMMAWTIYAGMRNKGDQFAEVVELELEAPMPMRKALTWLVLGLIVLVLSSRMLVWGGVEIATAFGISDLIIGLTIVAIGTSLPELASSIAAVRKNEHDLALGNVIGSNLFNTSIVVGITGLIAPTTLEAGILARDIPVLIILTAALFIMGYGFKGPGTGKINRLEGLLLLFAYAAYNVSLVFTAVITKN